MSDNESDRSTQSGTSGTDSYGYVNATGSITIDLSADRTQFFVGEDSQVTLSVRLPSDKSDQNVSVLDNEGKEAGIISANDLTMADNGSLQGSLTINLDTSQDGVQTYTASCGDAESPSLNVYITPHISQENINESIDIIAELGTHIDEESISDTPTSDQLQELADWLENQESVRSATAYDQAIFFTTTSGVLSGYSFEAMSPDVDGTVESGAAKNDTQSQLTGTGTASATQDNSGATDDSTSSDEAEKLTLKNAVTLFQKYGADTRVSEENHPVIFEGNHVGTNSNSLLIVPIRDYMANNTLIDESLSDYARSMGGKLDKKEGEDALLSLVSEQAITRYGTVNIWTHGVKYAGLWNNHNRNSNAVCYTMAFEPFSNTKNWFKTLSQNSTYRNNLSDSLENIAKKAYEVDPQGKDSYEDFYSTWYGDDKDSSTWRMCYVLEPTVSGKSGIGIYVTSDFLMDRYQNCSLDNTVIMFNVCHGLSDEDFDRFLISKGAKAIYGYIPPVNSELDTDASYAIFENLSELEISNTAAGKTATVEEVGAFCSADPTNNMGINNKDQLANNGISYSGVLPISRFSGSTDVEGGLSDQTTYYYGDDQFFARGIGTITGTVARKTVLIDMDLNETESAVEPYAGAKVELFRFYNQQFEKLGEVTTDKDGTYTFDEVKMGTIIIKVSDDQGYNEVRAYQFEDESFDAGQIVTTPLYLYKMEIRVTDSEGNLTVPDSIHVYKSRDIKDKNEITLQTGSDSWPYFAGVTSNVYSFVVTKEGYSDYSTEQNIMEPAQITLQLTKSQEASSGVNTLKDQIQVLVDNMNLMRSDEAFNGMEEYPPVCWVSDYDRDGHLECTLSISMAGSGLFTYSCCYEVNEDISGVNKIAWDTETYAPDWFVDLNNTEDSHEDRERIGYYDPSSGVYYYILYDILNAGAAGSYTAYYAMSLQNNSFVWQDLGYLSNERASGGSFITTYAVGDTQYSSKDELFAAMKSGFSGMEETPYHVTSFIPDDSTDLYSDLLASAMSFLGESAANAAASSDSNASSSAAATGDSTASSNAAATGDSTASTAASEKSLSDYSRDELIQKVVEHYTALWQPDGTYSLSEVTDTDEGFSGMLRLASNNGGSANVIVTLITVNTSTGYVEDADGYADGWYIT